MAQRKREDCRESEQDRDLDAILQVLDRTEDQQIAVMHRGGIALELKKERVARLARQCLRQVRRISPSMVLEAEQR